MLHRIHVCIWNKCGFNCRRCKFRRFQSRQAVFCPPPPHPTVAPVVVGSALQMVIVYKSLVSFSLKHLAAAVNIQPGCTCPYFFVITPCTLSDSSCHKGVGYKRLAGKVSVVAGELCVVSLQKRRANVKNGVFFFFFITDVYEGV